MPASEVGRGQQSRSEASSRRSTAGTRETGGAERSRTPWKGDLDIMGNKSTGLFSKLVHFLTPKGTLRLSLWIRCARPKDYVEIGSPRYLDATRLRCLTCVVRELGSCQLWRVVGVKSTVAQARPSGFRLFRRTLAVRRRLGGKVG